LRSGSAPLDIDGKFFSSTLGGATGCFLHDATHASDRKNIKAAALDLFLNIVVSFFQFCVNEPFDLV